MAYVLRLTTFEGVLCIPVLYSVIVVIGGLRDRAEQRPKEDDCRLNSVSASKENKFIEATPPKHHRIHWAVQFGLLRALLIPRSLLNPSLSLPQ